MGDLVVCTKCGETRPRAAFLRSKRNASGLQQPCKPCKNETRRAWYAANPGTAQGINRQWRENNPEKASASQRRNELRRRYALTPAAYSSLLEAQGGVCGICGRTQRSKRLAVDHDHVCCPGARSCGACVRGLLCDPCNRTLGWAERNREAVTAYLDRFTR